MVNLYKDPRFHSILAANILSSIGSGITMTAVPWLLISKVEGGTLFGYITIVMTVINFLTTPIIGHVIDQYPRKNILLLGEILGFFLLLFFALEGIMGVNYELWHYIVLYGSASFYYNLFYPAIFAFNQEIFEPAAYRPLSGAMEIQGQLSSVISGALAAALLSRIDLHWLLLFDAATYLSAFLLFYKIPYHQQKRQVTQKVLFWIKVTEGYRYMHKRPALFLFLTASFMPFIGVMVTNYVNPVYLKNILHADVAVYGMQGMVYGIGAAAAGVIIPILALKKGNEFSILISVFVYAAGISVVIFTKSISVFYLLTILMAYGNAGTRVARNAFMMENVPNEVMGRTDSLFRLIGLGIRILLLSVFTELSIQNNITYSFYILSALLITCFLIIFILNRKAKVHKNWVIFKNTASH
ncbi:MFS transporter [Neobacillus terrae]|uniref:MFS transporter n=1 Tax=Neobacillus terrae TaxID=3034837 RepID=UPI00140B4636|nr:MFS transporter [Neobacillus terrae]NHM31818.1 MFS transporter [Neobacillus terrae]